MKIGYRDYQAEITREDVSGILRFLAELKGRLFVPKNKKDKAGIIVAITTENEKEKLRLENDLILNLKEYLKKSKQTAEFNVIKFPEFLSSKITDYETATLYLRRARAHFMVYGHLAERNIGSSNTYIFKLYGVVRHFPIVKVVQQRLAEDFSSSLPWKIKFSETKEELGFEVTQELIGYTIKFIIGCAALVSGDVQTSYELLNDLFVELSALVSKGNNNLVLSEILKRNRIRLIEVLLLKINIGYYSYAITREESKIFETKQPLKELFKIDPDNYQGHLINAIILFKESKVDDAIKELETIYNNKDLTWRYSLGFLYAYKGEIDKALEQYKKALYVDVASNVINDTEIFISEEISKNPELIQLIFFRGLISYKGKADYLLAKQDFRSFVENKDTEKYPRLTELSKKYLKEIESHLSI